VAARRTGRGDAQTPGDGVASRRSLGHAGSILETVASGYRLAVEADAIDARRFETLIGEARAARVGGDAAAARRLLDDALELWRGSALADAAFALLAGVSQVHVRRPRRTMPSRLGGLTAASATPKAMRASCLSGPGRSGLVHLERLVRGRRVGRPRSRL
jgi:anti-sigma-K factor RskA